MDLATHTLTRTSVSHQKLNMLVKIPGPANYDKRSDFDKSKPHMPQISFGVGRSAFDRVVVPEMGQSTVTDKNVPGPGTYSSHHINSLGQSQTKFTMRGKNEGDNWLSGKSKVPGPGSYEPRLNIADYGSFSISTFK